MDEIRVIIAGGRDFDNYELLKEKSLDILNKISNDKHLIKIVSGTARGADTLGEKFAQENGYKLQRFPADWNGLGKMAGFVRNIQMGKYASEPDIYGVLIAFWDGSSRGTQHMIQIAQNFGLYVNVIKYNK